MTEECYIEPELVTKNGRKISGRRKMEEEPIRNNVRGRKEEIYDDKYETIEKKGLMDNIKENKVLIIVFAVVIILLIVIIVWMITKNDDKKKETKPPVPPAPPNPSANPPNNARPGPGTNSGVNPAANPGASSANVQSNQLNEQSRGRASG